MSAQDFLSSVSQVIYLALFVVATVRFARRPAWASFDTFLFFAVIAVLLLVGDAAGALGFEGHPLYNILVWVGVSALPFILLRLVDDFRPQPMLVMVTASAAFLVVAAVGFVAPQPWGAVSLVVVVFVAVLGLYASLGFLREARRSTGVTRRRMQAVAFGSGLLALVLVLAGVRVVVPEGTEWLALASQVIGLGLVVSYFVGFAPPAMLRRAWQEPTLRTLLAEAPEMVQLPDARAVADQLEASAVGATGADGAAIGLWDEEAQQLVFRGGGSDGETRVRPGEFIAGRSFERQLRIFSNRAERDAPEHADEYRRTGIHAIAAAPISTDDRRLGVLVVYAARPPLFTDDVLSIIGLMAEQAALVLRSQQLLREAAQVRAMAEVTRLKDDFLSVVAHDVRTPLTAILLNAELLERGLPGGDQNARRATSLRNEALRLKQLVEDYLDVVRADHARSTRREEHDLVELVNEAVLGTAGANGRVRVTGPTAIQGSFDGPRIRQLVQNLVSNALKYSETDAQVEIGLTADDAWVTMTVTDHGIGIPESDLGLLFERFHRGQNADDRRYGGLGLGLYICRQVAEEHGGTIEATSRIGEGTTFTVRLARRSESAEAVRAAAPEPSPADPIRPLRPSESSPHVADPAPPSVTDLPGEATT